MPFSYKMTKSNIMEKLQTIRSEKTADSSRKGGDSRGIDSLLELVREDSMVSIYRFNDMTDFDIDCLPVDLWEELNSFNCDFFDSKLDLDLNVEKKYIKMNLKEPATIEPSMNSKYGQEQHLELNPLEIKVKFYRTKPAVDEDDKEEVEDECSERFRVKFILKKGSPADWYELFSKMQETSLEGLLLSTREHLQELCFLDADEPDFDRASSTASERHLSTESGHLRMVAL